MGTRSCVGAYTEPEQKGFVGTYCHWDGYPDGVGQTIWEHLQKWEWNWGRMAEFLNMPKTSWSALCGSNFDLKPSWNNETCDRTTYERLEHGPIWYDDREDYPEEPSIKMTEFPDRESWMEWIYVVDPFSKRMLVKSIYSGNEVWIAEGEDYYLKVVKFFNPEEEE